jgi:hypothetical protein
MRRLLVACVAAAALTFPGQALAGYWSWGHNYIDVGGYAQSGWNYWQDQYQHKHSQPTSATRQVFVRWDKSCYHDLVGGSAGSEVYWYWTAGDAGCGGYIGNLLQYLYGGNSYTFIDSFA